MTQGSPATTEIQSPRLDGRKLWSVLLARMPVLLLALVYGLFAYFLPGQLSEVLRTLVHEPVRLVLTGIVGPTVFCTVHLILLAAKGPVSRWQDTTLVVLPAAALAASFGLAMPDPVTVGIAVCLIIGLWAGIFAVAPRLVAQARKSAVYLYQLAAIGFAGMVVATLLSPVDFPRVVGSVGLLVAGLGFTSIGLAALMHFKWVGIIGALAILLCLALDGPVHQVRRIHPPAVAKGSAFETEFVAWLAARQDREAYVAAKLPYPVFISSSSGGGIYAAVHAYSVLSGMSAYCPNFSQHLLASVGVSGGSYGIALYGADVDGKRQPQDVLPCASTGLVASNPGLSADHLAPVLAALFFVELPTAILPGRIGEFDSATALEWSFERPTPDLPAIDFLQRDFSSVWRSDGIAPMLNFVSADVAQGNRFVLGQHEPLEYETYSDWLGRYSLAKEGGIHVGSAAAISARFPWLTPVAELTLDPTPGQYFDGDKMVDLPQTTDYRMLADGGYFENTGSETAWDLMLAIEAMGREIDLCISGDRTNCRAGWMKDEAGQLCPIIIHTSPKEPADWSGCSRHVFLASIYMGGRLTDFPGHLMGSQPPVSVSPLWGPVEILLKVWRSRTVLAYSRLSRDLCDRNCAGDGNSGLYGFYLDDDAVELPLGWTLSMTTLQRLLDLTPNPAKCHATAAKGEDEDYAAARSQFGCQALEISRLFELP